MNPQKSSRSSLSETEAPPNRNLPLHLQKASSSLFTLSTPVSTDVPNPSSLASVSRSIASDQPNLSQQKGNHITLKKGVITTCDATDFLSRSS
uniref:Uncharacterized protein n=1 Tax=Panagrellus redivivus TaxID=6233 RepID=A0A7E4UMY2_PANRE